MNRAEVDSTFQGFAMVTLHSLSTYHNPYRHIARRLQTV